MGFPKLYNDIASHNEAVRAYFDDRIDRPLIIAGNGPSSAEPFVDRLPDDPVVFRMNWFFLESTYSYGRRVDGFFWSLDTPALQDELSRVISRRDYDIRAYFAPMRAQKKTEDGTALNEDFRPFFDHWAVIAENATLARELMGRPLPTQGFQVLAFALALGFREIHLAGIDLYQSRTRRYAYHIPDRIARRLEPKDIAPGYENAHGLDRDISFFEALKKQYPDARMYALSDSPFLCRELQQKEAGPKGGAAQIAAYESFRPGTITLPDGTRKPVGELGATELDACSKRIGNARCAFVTLVAGGGFAHGARALANSLRNVSDVPLIVMCLPETEKSLLSGENVALYDLEPIENPNALSNSNKRFRNTYSKLGIFGMTAWDRLVYVDADALVLQNIDDLFELDEFSAAPDVGLELNYDRFNSGVFVCQPSAEQFEDMLGRLRDLPSYDGGDQGFLNAYFPEPRFLDRGYNMLKRVYVHHPNLFRWEDVKVLHFVGRKPWDTVFGGDKRYAALDRLWYESLTPGQLLDVIAYAERGREAPNHATTHPPQGSDGKFYRKLRKLRRDPMRFVKDSRVVRAVGERKALRSFLNRVQK